jgi:asparagine synthase (glutamine-hydrolysing)
VVAFARRYSKEKLQCFTIAIQGYENEMEGNVADLPYARKVAAHLGVDLHTVTVGPDMIDHLKEMIYFLDEPQADPAPINAMLICKLAREHGIKVLLSGAGGDDIFSGYRRHRAIMQEPRWSWLPVQFRQGLRLLSQKLPANASLPRRIRKAFEYARLNGAEHLASYFYWLDPHGAGELLSPELRRQVADGAVPLPLIQALERLPELASDLSRMLYLEGKFFLPDHNLNYTDKMSMSQGVEVRVPLLDKDLVALAARLPDKMKQRGATGKWIFKKAMEPYLPHDVIYRPKTGFGAPLRSWLRNELRPLVEDVLSPRSLKLRGLFDPVAVQKLLQSDREGRVDAAYPIFAMICIELWCQIFLE